MLNLIIGNKNYSSWSMRPWVLMRHLDIPFAERKLRLGSAEFYAVLAPITRTQTVPVLIDGSLVVPDSLAIAEFMAERDRQQRVWPVDAAQRARARVLCASIHAGFQTLREHMPMNIEASLPGMGWNVAVQRDIDRICTLWDAALQSSGGPFLFGAFGAVDAFCAPICARFRTYAPRLPDAAAAYAQRVLDLPAVRQWCDEARAEHDFIVADEPYRLRPDWT